MTGKTANTVMALAAFARLTPAVRGHNHRMDGMRKRIRCGGLGSLGDQHDADHAQSASTEVTS